MQYLEELVLKVLKTFVQLVEDKRGLAEDELQ